MSIRRLAIALLCLATVLLAPPTGAQVPPTEGTATTEADQPTTTSASPQPGPTLPPPDADGGLQFIDQTPWRVGAEPAQLRFRITSTAPADGLEVALAFYPRITSRSEFTQTLDGRVRRSALRLEQFPVPSLVSDPTGIISLPLDAVVTRQGVYPVRLELRETASGDVVDAFTTYLSHLPEPIEGEKLTVGLAVPFGAPVVTRADGSFDMDDETVQRLEALAAAFSRTTIPFTVMPRGESLDALANGTGTEGRTVLTSLSAAAPGRLFLPHHYVDTSLPSLLEVGLSNEAERQAIRAAAAVGAQVSGAAISAGIWVSDENVDEATIAHLASRGVTRIVVPEAALTPLDLEITLTQTFGLRVGGDALEAAAADAGLRAHFLSKGDPALAAHHLLADLAVLYFDRPGLSRGIAVVPPSTWDAEPRFVDALLQGLSTSPVLSSQTLATMFDAVPPLEQRGVATMRSLEDDAGPSLVPIDARTVRSTRDRLESLIRVLSPFNPIVEQVDRTLLSSESARLSRGDRRELLAGANDQIEAVLDQVSLPGNRSITLTAREGEIPITISSDIPYPIHAALRLSSGPLTFPRGDTIPIELTRSNLTQRVTVRANTSGSFPLRVELVSPDGRLVLGETRVTVRSTAVSGVGVALSVGAALFLALWWARHLRGQRSKRLVPT